MNTSIQLVRRLALALSLVFSIAAMGCVGSMEPLGDDDTAGDDDDAPPTPDAQTPIPGTPDAGTPEPQSAEELFAANVQPKLSGCAPCHGVAGALGFMGTGGAPGYYDAILASGVFNAANPITSKILTHTHATASYPEFDADTKTKVEEWLAAEGQ